MGQFRNRTRYHASPYPAQHSWEDFGADDELLEGYEHARNVMRSGWLKQMVIIAFLCLAIVGGGVNVVLSRTWAAVTINRVAADIRNDIQHVKADVTALNISISILESRIPETSSTSYSSLGRRTSLPHVQTMTPTPTTEENLPPTMNECLHIS